ncbi:uncharacterized protein DNG_09645 [Cephalotrichum gorgonifer]|uniref:Uncharacterized protein n=1 Tax=Cephalotrichum gorgonifer TaxID=2041049 RepID=A0AAE8N634_9PEZI|nr:uncharacterized protein DNG_09645 [Cephalotrichum gorgonifer]
MSFPRAVGTATAVLGATVVGSWAFMVRQRTAGPMRITFSDSIPQSFKDSASVKELVNPRGHQDVADSYAATLTIPRPLRNTSDEDLLARFVSGFFGGYTLSPERLLLRLVGKRLVSFSKIDAVAGAEGRPIWSLSEIPTDQLPPVHSVLFGAFQISSIRLVDQNASGISPSSSDEGSHVDFVFGTDKGQFAGVHRFRVSRPRRLKGEERAGGGDEELVTVHLEHMSCNPAVDKALKPDFLLTLHKIYATLLFREGVAEIKRRCEEECG